MARCAAVRRWPGTRNTPTATPIPTKNNAIAINGPRAGADDVREDPDDRHDLARLAGDERLDSDRGGRSGTRTHGPLAGPTVFKTVALVRSAILPMRSLRGRRDPFIAWPSPSLGQGLEGRCVAWASSPDLRSGDGKARKGAHEMAYVIAEPCMDVHDRGCVDECPVDCIYDGLAQDYIHPDECVDCGACEPVCPVTAIFSRDDIPDGGADTRRSSASSSGPASPTSGTRRCCPGRGYARRPPVGRRTPRRRRSLRRRWWACRAGLALGDERGGFRDA